MTGGNLLCYAFSVILILSRKEAQMAYKIDPLSDDRFNFKAGDAVLVLSTNGRRLGTGEVDSELSPGIFGVVMDNGRRKGLNGCLLRHQVAV